MLGSTSGLGWPPYTAPPIDAASGKALWTYQTGGAVDSSPAVAGGVIYVGSLDHRVYAPDAVSGKLLWSFVTGG